MKLPAKIAIGLTLAAGVGVVAKGVYEHKKGKSAPEPTVIVGRRGPHHRPAVNRCPNEKSHETKGHCSTCGYCPPCGMG